MYMMNRIVKLRLIIMIRKEISFHGKIPDMPVYTGSMMIMGSSFQNVITVRIILFLSIRNIIAPVFGMSMMKWAIK